MQRQQFKTTLASIGDGVIATDVDGNITFLNAVAGTLTGWKQGEASGTPLKTIFQIINEDSRKRVDNPALRRSGKTVSSLWRTIHC